MSRHEGDDHRSVEAAFAAAAAALVDDYDVVGVTSRLLRDCADLTGVQAAGLAVRAPSGQLDVLASTSHAVHELELYQMQADAGPCVDAMRSGRWVCATDAEQIRGQWPQLADAFAAAGFAGVNALPLRWHGETIGALNLFSRNAGELHEPQRLLGQAFADVATLTIVHANQARADTVTQQTREALAGRTVIEQAKGVLAYQRGVDVGTAFTMLMQLADERDKLLSVVAADVIAAAVHG